MYLFKIKIFLIATLFFSFKLSFASHFRAGEILYEYLSPQTYRVMINTYTEDNLANQDQDSVYLNWGDGSFESVGRTNGPLNSNGVPSGELISTSIKKNVYISALHTYSSSLPYYTISITEFNRVDGVINMTNSVDVPFYLEDTINNSLINLYGINSSPVFLNEPIDYGNRLDTFYHSPNAYDADGDSLFYELTPSMQASGSQVPQYQFPDQILAGINNNLSINEYSGLITWATPQTTGDYNISFRVKEYRNSQLIGSVTRDMQILVSDENNSPPQINAINDLTVFAGDTIDISFQISDIDISDSLTVIASGSPFVLNPNRVQFNTTNTGNTVQANFVWYTDCSDITKEPYYIDIKAFDDYTNVSSTPISLSANEMFKIKILPKPVDLLDLEVLDESIKLEWSTQNICLDSSNFLNYSIWRKKGCDTLSEEPFYLVEDKIESTEFIDLTYLSEAYQTYKVNANFGKINNGIEYNIGSYTLSNKVCVLSLKNYLSVNTLEKPVVSIFPNPSTKSFKVNSDLTIKSIEVYNLNGKLISRNKESNLISSIGFENGFYYVKVNFESGKFTTEKILVNRK